MTGLATKRWAGNRVAEKRLAETGLTETRLTGNCSAIAGRASSGTRHPATLGLGVIAAVLAGVVASATTLAASTMPSAAGPKATDPLASRSEPRDEPTQGNIGHPYTLPAAPRARMHACGIEWQTMKMSGAADDKTWRVFASVCLTDPTKESDRTGTTKALPQSPPKPDESDRER